MLVGGREKVETDEVGRVSFPSLPSTAMFTPSQLLVASQTAALMAASGLAGAPAFFHPGLFHPGAWGLHPGTPRSASPPSIPHNNNNNNVVSSSSADLVKSARRKIRKIESEDGRGEKEKAEKEKIGTQINGNSPPSSTGDKELGPVAPNRDKQFTCGVCKRSFGYKHVLQNHERTHTGEKPFECPECHKRFTRDHHLKTHMRLHTGERPYHCEYCDRQFVQVANLRRHLRVHTGERPYACQYCSARFSDSNQLKAHVLIHKGEKPFECERCSGRFRRRHHLLHHKCVGGGGGGGTVPRSCSPPASDLSDELYPAIEQERRPRTTSPLVTLPMALALPEQTEPEDLSMSTGLHSHSSGDSPRSRSPHQEDLSEVDEDYELEDATALFLQRRPPHPS